MTGDNITVTEKENRRNIWIPIAVCALSAAVLSCVGYGYTKLYQSLRGCEEKIAHISQRISSLESMMEEYGDKGTKKDQALKRSLTILNKFLQVQEQLRIFKLLVESGSVFDVAYERLSFDPAKVLGEARHQRLSSLSYCGVKPLGVLKQLFFSMAKSKIYSFDNRAGIWKNLKRFFYKICAIQPTYKTFPTPTTQYELLVTIGSLLVDDEPDKIPDILDESLVPLDEDLKSWVEDFNNWRFANHSLDTLLHGMCALENIEKAVR